MTGQPIEVEPALDLDGVIRNAKLGRTRKDAQEDTCAVFAAALFDLLTERGVACRMVTVAGGFSPLTRWYHAVVEVGDVHYDSMGEFSEDIWRRRAKIHPRVTTSLTYRQDVREDCYEEEFEEMHRFYLKALRSSLGKAAIPAQVQENVNNGHRSHGTETR